MAGLQCHYHLLRNELVSSDLNTMTLTEKWGGMKTGRNIMKCWEILSAIFTDIGLRLRGDIIPELLTVPTIIEKSKSPISDIGGKQMAGGIS